MMIFPLIPEEKKRELPTESKVQFEHPHNLGAFTFTVTKSPAGLNVSIRPVGVEPGFSSVNKQAPSETVNNIGSPIAVDHSFSDIEINNTLGTEVINETDHTTVDGQDLDLPFVSAPVPAGHEVVDLSSPDVQTAFSENATYEPPGERDHFDFNAAAFDSPAKEFVLPIDDNLLSPDSADADRRTYSDRRRENTVMASRMDALFNRLAETGSSDLHLSVTMPPLVRKDGKIQRLECDEGEISAEVMRELLFSIMPGNNRDEFDRRHDTDFAYEIHNVARFRCNVFMDRKGMGGVFRIIPAKMTTAEQLGLSSAILGLCELSKGLVVVTGPTGSGKSTTLCAMVNHINQNREDHIITIEDPIEFVHDNIKCLVNQREVHNHTDSFKDALRAALREDPDILLVGEMRDLETISIAIETAETGHLVFGTLHTTTAASTVERIIDQFPSDRQQQIRVMLSESLKGVIAQTLLPKKGGGRIAALEVLIVTPAISNLIREGKTFQIPSAMQTGKNHGMVMLNDALFDLVKNDVVEPREAYIKAVDKAGFETMLTRGGFKI